jgi:Domain of unknown function (DUF5658)
VTVIRALPLFAFAFVLTTTPASAQDTPRQSFRESIADSVLRSLYVSTPILHAIDGWTTLQVIKLGGREMNPIIATSARHPALLAGVKGAFAAGEIYVVHRIGKTHKFRAIAAIAGLNVAYAMVTAHNLRIANELRGQEPIASR